MNHAMSRRRGNESAEDILQPLEDFLNEGQFKKKRLGTIIGKQCEAEKRKRTTRPLSSATTLTRPRPSVGTNASSAVIGPSVDFHSPEVEISNEDDDEFSNPGSISPTPRGDDHSLSNFDAVRGDCLRLLEGVSRQINEVQPERVTWRQRAETAYRKWESCRSSIFGAILAEENCLDRERLCDICHQHTPTTRCFDCFNIKICPTCDSTLHKSLPFHDRDVNFKGFWEPVPPNSSLDSNGQIVNNVILLPVFLSPSSSLFCEQCGQKGIQQTLDNPVAFVTVKGRYDMFKYEITCDFCKTSVDPFKVENLICKGYWPGSTSNIFYLFSIEVFRLWDVLRKRLPGSSSRGFLKSLEDVSRNKGRVGIINAEAFDSAFDEWCYMVYEMNVLACHNTLECPCCKGEQQSAHCDGDAKLVRCKSSGEKIRDSYYKEAFIYSNERVDQLLAEVYRKRDRQRSDAIDNRCGDTVWKAASNMPRRKRNLCETGLQVVVCRHGLAQKAVNMFQGELYGYSLFLQKHLMKPNNVKFMIIDVACKYWIWLRKNDADLSQEMEPAIGAMHCKRHIASCQINYGARWTSGLGLTAGEECEQFFSYFSRLGNNTKHMLPEGREETLTEHAMSWNERKLEHIAESIARKHMRVKDSINQMSAQIADETTKMGISHDSLYEMMENMQKWAKSDHSQKKKANFTLDEDAFLIAYTLYTEGQLPNYITLDFGSNMMDLPVKMLNHECTGRGVFWKQNYLREYLETNKDFTPANHFVEVCQKLLPCVQDQIESKYLDTVQKAMSHKKIAATCKQRTTLWKQLSKERENLRTYIDSYNDLVGHISTLQIGDSYTFVTDKHISDGTFPWLSHSQLNDISIEQRELLETFVFVLRSKEELRILQREMENYLAYYRDSVVVLRRKIKEASDLRERTIHVNAVDELMPSVDEQEESTRYWSDCSTAATIGGKVSLYKRGLDFAISQITKGLTWFDKTFDETSSTEQADEIDDDYHDFSAYDIENTSLPQLEKEFSQTQMQPRRTNLGIELRSLTKRSKKFSVSTNDADGVLVSYFPRSVAQSTEENAGNEFASGISDILIACWYHSESYSIELCHDLPLEMQSLVANSIIFANTIYSESRASLPQREISIEEAITAVSDWLPVSVEDFIACTEYNPDSLETTVYGQLKRLLNLKKRIAAIIINGDKTGVVLFSEESNILFVDTRAHTRIYGAIVIRSNSSAFKDFYGIMDAVMPSINKKSSIIIIT